MLSALGTVRGQPIWSGVAGPRDDYVLTLEIGEKRRRVSRLGAQELSFNKRTFEGAFGFIIECPWRFESSDQVLCSCFELLEPTGRGPREIAGMADAVIEDVAIIAPAYDLLIQLSGGLRIFAFSSETNPKKKRNNWSFWSQRHLLTIGPKGTVALRDRQAEEAEQRNKAHAYEADEVVVRLPTRNREDPKK